MNEKLRFNALDKDAEVPRVKGTYRIGFNQEQRHL